MRDGGPLSSGAGLLRDLIYLLEEFGPDPAIVRTFGIRPLSSPRTWWEAAVPPAQRRAERTRARLRTRTVTP